MWARRLIVGSGLAVASIAMASGAAGAATCTSAGSMTQPSCVTTPTVAGTSTVAPAKASALPAADGASHDGPTSLPFTGADFEGMAVVGAGAVLAGGLLLHRRRRQTA